MSDLRNELLDCYNELIDADYEAAASSAEKEHIDGSARFKKHMAALLRDGRPVKKPSRSRRVRKALLLSAALLLLAAALACAHPSVRKSMVGFFVKVFGTHDRYSEPVITRESFDVIYGLDPLPEGFTEIRVNREKDCVTSTYSDESGHTLTLSQYVKGNVSPVVDNEHGQAYEHTIDGAAVYIRHTERGSVAAWLRDGYYFVLSCGSPISLDEFEAIVASVNPRE